MVLGDTSQSSGPAGAIAMGSAPSSVSCGPGGTLRQGHTVGWAVQTGRPGKEVQGPSPAPRPWLLSVRVNVNLDSKPDGS